MKKMDRKELLDLKEKIEESKVSKIQLETKKESLIEDMKEKWGCETVEEAKAKIEELDRELKENYETLQDELEEVGVAVSEIDGDTDEYEL